MELSKTKYTLFTKLLYIDECVELWTLLYAGYLHETLSIEARAHAAK